MKSHVIFDWNGTLIDDAWVFVDVLNIILKEQRLSPINVDIYKDLFTFPIKKFYNRLGVDTSESNFNKIEERFIHEYNLRKYNATLHDNVPLILSELLANGVSLSILSASNKEILKDMVSHYNLNEYFDDIVGVNNHQANGKIEMGKRLIDKNNLDPKKIILVGDTDYDCLVANSLDIDCILVSNGHQSLKQLQAVNTNIIDDLSVFLNLMVNKTDDYQ